MSRLPEPGSDKGTWGDILNDYLLQAHNADGTLKANAVTADVIAANSVTSAAIAPNAITGAQLAVDSVDATAIIDGSITETQLSSDIQASLANANAAVSGTAPDASTTTKGIVQLTGDLAGTATAPVIAAGVITDSNISGSAAISQTKVNGLTTSLSGKEPAITAGTTGQYFRGDKTFQTLDQTAVGLANVDNTSDADKPVSTATQTALNLKATAASLSTVATTGHYSDLTGTPTLATVATTGHYSDLSGAPTLSTVATSGSYTDLTNKPTIPTVPVTSVAGRTGDVTLTSADVGLSNVNNTSDANKPISTATQTALNLKAATSSLATVATTGHYSDLTGAPTLATVATSGSYTDLTSKPTLATVATTGHYSDLTGTPTLATVATSGNYSDLSGAPSNATSSTAGLIELTGDLGGTATSPSVAKVNGVAVTGTPSSGQVITATSSSAASWASPSSVAPGGTVFLDSFAGANDDAKLTAAMTYVQAQTNMPAIQLPGRNLTFSTAQTPFSGLKIIGTSGGGPKNLEISSGKLVATTITVSVGGAWWTGTGTYYDIYFSNMAITYTNSSSFWSQASGTLYACEFHSLDHNAAVSVFGTSSTKALLTQVIFSGHWTVENGTSMQFHIGGSDNAFWTDGYLNIQGPTTTAGGGMYQMYFDFCGKTDVANIYCTSINGWRGIKTSGSAGSYGITFTGCRTEGDNAATPTDGVQFLVTGGGVSIRDHWVAYGMNAPLTGEYGLLQVTGGDVSIDRVHYNRGNTSQTVPLVYVSGGTVKVRALASATADGIYVQNAGGSLTIDDPTVQTVGSVTVAAYAVSPKQTIEGAVLDLPGTTIDYLSAPAIATAPTNLDLQAYVAPTSWTSSNTKTIYSDTDAGSVSKSFYWGISNSGYQVLVLSFDGVTSNNYQSTVVTPGSANGVFSYIRATYLANNGGGNGLVTWYSSTDGVTWTSYDSTVVSGTTALNQSTHPISIGIRDSTDLPFTGRISYVSCSYTIGGSAVAGVDFRGKWQGVDTAGNVWTLSGSASTWVAVEASVANLVSDLSLKAPLASPTFTGTVTVPTPVNPTDAVQKQYVDASSSSLLGFSPSWHGLAGWSGDFSIAQSGTPVTTAGALNLSRIRVPAGSATISTIHLYVSAAGSGLTNVGFATFAGATNGALKQSVVNTNGATTTAFQTVGLQTVTITSHVLNDGDYVGFWFTGTTLPSIERIANTQMVSVGASPFRFATANTGLTTAAPSTLSTQAAINISWTIGVA